MWMVRAASGGVLADQFREKGVVAIGWSDVGDLSRFKNKEEFLEAVASTYPDWSAGRQQSSASQLVRFRDEPSVGDRVVTYDSGRRIYHLGTITSGYRRVPDAVPPYENVRDVQWEAEVERDRLSVRTRNSLGSTFTLSRLPDFAAQVRISFLTDLLRIRWNLSVGMRRLLTYCSVSRIRKNEAPEWRRF